MTYICSTDVASSVPFDNTATGFTATDVQAAILETTRYLNEVEVTATATATASTAVDVLMTGMTLTSVAGTYIAWFSCDIASTVGGSIVSVSFYIGGVQQLSSLRKVIPFFGGVGSTGAGRISTSFQSAVTVNGSQALEVRWSVNTGSVTTASRALTTLRVG